jgi:flagellin-like hook-associated protein FlgL
MAAKPSSNESDDLNSLNKEIDKLTNELTNLVSKSNERGVVLSNSNNRHIQTLQEAINNLKLKRQSLLKKSYTSKISDITEKKVSFVIVIHILCDFY